MAAPSLFIEPCHPDDERRDAWIENAACALSPVATVRDSGIATLLDMGFQVLHGPGPAPPGQPHSPTPRAGPLLALTSATLVLGAVMLNARPGWGGPICGEMTAKGTPCGNPKASCPIDHRGVERRHGRGFRNPVRRSKHRRKLKGMRAVGKASNQNLPEGQPAQALRAAVSLDKASLLHAPSCEASHPLVDPDALAHIARVKKGFTVDPRGVGDRSRDPKSGVCVTLDNTALKWDVSSLGTAFDPQSGEPRQELLRHIGLWLQDCDVALRSGNCWIGGWHNPQTGEMELNLTTVFRAEHRNEARAFGHLQGQVAVYDLDVAAYDRNAAAIKVGSGGETPWSPP